MELRSSKRPSNGNRELAGSFLLKQVANIPRNWRDEEKLSEAKIQPEDISYLDYNGIIPIQTASFDANIINTEEISLIAVRNSKSLDEVDFARTASLLLNDSAIVSKYIAALRLSDLKNEVSERRVVDEVERCRKRYQITSQKLATPSKLPKAQQLLIEKKGSKVIVSESKSGSKPLNHHLPQLRLVLNQITANQTDSPHSGSCGTDINTLASLDLNDWLHISSNDGHFPNIVNSSRGSRPVSPIMRISTPKLPDIGSTSSSSPLIELGKLNHVLREIRIRESKTHENEDNRTEDDDVSVDSLVEMLRNASRAGQHAASLAILLNT